ncbi:MAG TPA: tyrosine-type recombinase/integrase, partial [Bacteroidota bacterium]|nr:tyrosine-type recombinase/integrase [Bacteroidota bacterium]
ITKNTISMRRRYVTAFLKSLRIRNDRADIRAVSVPQIYDCIMKAVKRMARPTQKQFMSSIRSFLKFAHLKGYISKDVTEAVPVIKTMKLGYVPRGISWESVEKLLTVAAAKRGTHAGRRAYAILRLLAAYGVRIGQVEKLRLQDINWREGTIRFRPSKFGNPLCFPLYPHVADALLAYIEKSRGRAPYPEVFLSVIGDPIPLRKGGAFYSSIKACFRNADINGKSAHAIRHAFATRLLECETPIKTISDLLGHKSIRNTFIYTKVDLKHLRPLAYEWPEVLP